MEKVDARKQTRDALYERRKEVIRLHREGVPVMQIASQIGLNPATVKVAIDLYEADGESALMPAARGRKQGAGRMLTEEQEAEIRQCIRVRRPWFYRLKDSLWNRDAVLGLIEQKFGVELSERGVGNYFKRWGIALRDPGKRPYERCSTAVQNWLAVNYAEIEQQAKNEQAEIYWLNRPAAVDTVLWCRTNAPKGQASAASAGVGTGERRSMISVVNSQGKVSWAIIDGPFNPERQVQFMKALIKESRKKVLFLIRSDWNECGSRQFMDWIGQQENKVKIYPASRDAIPKHG